VVLGIDILIPSIYRTSDSCITRPPKLSPLKGATMLKK
jgi:hypothetical protein